MQVKDILEVAEQFLKEMIVEYEKATANRIEAKAKAEKARKASETVTLMKEKIEQTGGVDIFVTTTGTVGTIRLETMKQMKKTRLLRIRICLTARPTWQILRLAKA